jgi:hypothetical protein
MLRDPFTMVVAIIAIITFGKIIKAKINARHGIIESRDVAGAIQQRFTGDQNENGQLREEITTLKERIQVLERIATDGDRGASLSREIEGLRDK